MIALIPLHIAIEHFRAAWATCRRQPLGKTAATMGLEIMILPIVLIVSYAVLIDGWTYGVAIKWRIAIMPAARRRKFQQSAGDAILKAAEDAKYPSGESAKHPASVAYRELLLSSARMIEMSREIEEQGDV